MNSSMFTADRTTHLKIVVVALFAATLVAGIGVAAKVTDLPKSTSASSGGGATPGAVNEIGPLEAPP